MRLVTQEQIVINVKLDTMVMELHVLAVELTRLHLQVGVLQLQTNVSLPSKLIHQKSKSWTNDFGFD